MHVQISTDVISAEQPKPCGTTAEAMKPSAEGSRTLTTPKFTSHHAAPPRPCLSWAPPQEVARLSGRADELTKACGDDRLPARRPAERGKVDDREVNKVKQDFAQPGSRSSLIVRGKVRERSATSLSRCPCEARCGADWRRAA